MQSEACLVTTGGERTAVPQAKPGLQLLGEVVEGTKDNLIKMINSRALEEHVMGPIPWASWLGKIMCTYMYLSYDLRSVYMLKYLNTSCSLPHLSLGLAPHKVSQVSLPQFFMWRVMLGRRIAGFGSISSLILSASQDFVMPTSLIG